MKQIPHRGVDLGSGVDGYVHLGTYVGKLNPYVQVDAGWYQNADGDLYHYDGTIWDTVPKEQIKDLEYLG